MCYDCVTLYIYINIYLFQCSLSLSLDTLLPVARRPVNQEQTPRLSFSQSASPAISLPVCQSVPALSYCQGCLSLFVPSICLSVCLLDLLQVVNLRGFVQNKLSADSSPRQLNTTTPLMRLRATGGNKNIPNLKFRVPTSTEKKCFPSSFQKFVVGHSKVMFRCASLSERPLVKASLLPESSSFPVGRERGRTDGDLLGMHRVEGFSVI